MITRLLQLAPAWGRICLLLVFFIPSVLKAAPAMQIGSAARPTVFDLLYGRDIVEVTLETDLVRMLENIKTDNYQSAIFSFDNEKGENISFQAEIRSRGNYRRRVCDFPPLKIKFAKEKLVGANIEPHNKLKLVTHCLDDKIDGQENLLKEYLAYKLYNELTDQSYRVQLIRINYVDTKGKLSRIRRYGILIEDTDEMAERLGGEECDCLNPAKEQLDTRLEGIHAVFQYMIGNEDWSMMMNRNLKVIKPLDGSKWKTVPYDFDFSGMVSAAYAVPNTQLGLTSIQERIYLGQPASDTELKYVFSYFRSKKQALQRLVDSCSYLSKEGRRQVSDYLGGFYQRIDYFEHEVGKDLYQAMTTPALPPDTGRKGGNSGK